MIRQHVRLKMPVDQTLFATTLTLLVIGLWMVFDSSFVKTLDSGKMGFDAFYFVKRQGVGALLGIAALFLMMQIGYWNLRRWAVPLMVLGLVLLGGVWLPHFGVVQNHAHRWLKIGPLSFQPSEFAKMTLILYLAALLSRPHCNVRHLGERGLAPALLVSGLYLLLIEREPDLGTAAVLFLGVLTQLILAGARRRHITLILGAAMLALFLATVGFGHRGHRITTFLHPELDKQGIGYQIYHARLGIGSGEWLGTGFGQGKEKYFLPQGNSDFIFATLAEEVGFVGSVLLLALLGLVGWRGFRIAMQTRDRFGALLAGGIASIISWQAIINIATATGSIPATGVPLPFISNGSTSLIFLLAGIGVLLNIAQYPTPPTESTKAI